MQYIVLVGLNTVVQNTVFQYFFLSSIFEVFELLALKMAKVCLGIGDGIVPHHEFPGNLHVFHALRLKYYIYYMYYIYYIYSYVRGLGNNEMFP